MPILNKDLRKRIIEKGTEMCCTHYGSSFSCLDCIKYLYDNVLREGKDIFILSKGHGEMALFAVLESREKKPAWTIHLNCNEDEGICATTGSLGHGLPIGVGRALAKKIKGEDGIVYVLCGDGEIEEGSVYEALCLAEALHLDNLNVLIDWNKYQANDSVKKIGNIDDISLKKRLEAFGWRVIKINGHDEKELEKLKYLGRGLNAVILDTIKGCGVKFLQEGHVHGFDFAKNPEKYKEAMEELR